MKIGVVDVVRCSSNKCTRCKSLMSLLAFCLIKINEGKATHMFAGILEVYAHVNSIKYEARNRKTGKRASHITHTHAHAYEEIHHVSPWYVKQKSKSKYTTFIHSLHLDIHWKVGAFHEICFIQLMVSTDLVFLFLSARLPLSPSLGLRIFFIFILAHLLRNHCRLYCENVHKLVL